MDCRYCQEPIPYTGVGRPREFCTAVCRRAFHRTGRPSGHPPLDLDADPRLFWDNVLIGDGCWEWQKGRFPTGYGSARYRKKTLPASRVAWALSHGGDLPPRNLFVCHHCDNPRCVRPDHLFLGTNSENQRDKIAKAGLWNDRDPVTGRWLRRKVAA